MRVINIGRPLPALAALSAAALATVAGVARADTDLVTNGGFEIANGDPTVAAGWNQTSAAVGRDTTNPHTGVADEFLNNNSGNPGNVFLFQDTPAASVTPGAVYTLNFYASGNFAVGGEGQYQVLFFGSNGPDASSGVHLINAGSAATVPNPSGYTLNTLTLPAAPSDAQFAEIQFFAVTGAAPGTLAQLYLDDVSLTTPGGSTGGGSATAWNQPGAGDWNVAANWTNGVPNAVGAEADFLGALTANHTVYTDVPVTVGTIKFANANQYVIGGAGSVTLQGTTAAPATVLVQQGTQKLSVPLIVASNATFNVSAGATLLVSNPVTVNAGQSLSSTGAGTVTYQSTVTVGTGGSIAFANSTYAHALTLAASATASVGASAGTRQLLQLDALSLDPTAKLDLANNDLVVHGGNVATVSGAVGSGYAGGTFNGGTGITSSAVAANARRNTALGVIANNAGAGAALYGSGTTLGLFDGTSPGANDVLVRYTYFGDANLDGRVNGADYGRIDAGYNARTSGSPLTGWYNGDFNYDGKVDGSDYTLIDNAFNTQGPAIASGAGQLATATAEVAGTAAVPEPTTVGVIGLAIAALAGRRRRI